MYAAGSSFDATLRVLAREMSASLGQQLVVDSRPGAGGIAATKLASAARPDGYTILAAGSAVSISQTLFKPQPYDVLKAFSPISTVTGSDLLVLVGPDSRQKTFAEMLREAKARGSRFMVGIGLLGTSQHLDAELLKLRTNLDFTIVPYRTTSALFAAVQSGDVDAAVEFAPVTLSLLQSGNLRALVCCSASRSPVLPNVPTATELGIAGLELESWGGLLAPAGTPDAIVQRLSLEVRKALAHPDLRNSLLRRGQRILGSTPEQTRDLIDKEIVHMANVMREAKIDLK